MNVYNEIKMEIKSARNKYSSFHSAHEGYAVIKEELDELWDLVRTSKTVMATDKMRKECIQIAAMSIRFVEDLSEIKK